MQNSHFDLFGLRCVWLLGRVGHTACEKCCASADAGVEFCVPERALDAGDHRCAGSVSVTTERIKGCAAAADEPVLVERLILQPGSVQATAGLDHGQQQRRSEQREHRRYGRSLRCGLLDALARARQREACHVAA